MRMSQIIRVVKDLANAINSPSVISAEGAIAQQSYVTEQEGPEPEIDKTDGMMHRPPL